MKYHIPNFVKGPRRKPGLRAQVNAAMKNTKNWHSKIAVEDLKIQKDGQVLHAERVKRGVCTSGYVVAPPQKLAVNLDAEPWEKAQG